MAFDLSEIPPALQSELLAEDGTQPPAGSLGWVAEPERSENGLSRIMAELDTTGLPTGRYEIRISYDSSPDGSGTASSRIVEIGPPGDSS
jgi:hypothetical protein